MLLASFKGAILIFVLFIYLCLFSVCVRARTSEHTCVCLYICVSDMQNSTCTHRGRGECPVCFLTFFLMPLRQSLFLDLFGSKHVPERPSLWLPPPTLQGLQGCVEPHPSFFVKVRISIQVLMCVQNHS